MEIGELARTLLFGERIEDKLFRPSDTLTDLDRGGPIDPPLFPGRPPRLARFGKTPFPSPEELADEHARGQLLHAFANHELLAMEIMALVLLRFPDAPESFRRGLVRTIQEEQNHLELYLNRMKELGVDFGDFPLSDYFWNLMKEVRSPLEFVVQMSLTFEQANLDFSLYYRDQVAAVGDSATAEVLDRVYREEIGHVKHGLTWFNRWRENPESESDWEAYRRLLPPPTNPTRAKSGVLYCAEARREAGLSEKFISELEIWSGSKGRPPRVWLYNPLCDSEIARGKPGFTPPAHVLRLQNDLEHLPMLLGHETDLLWVARRPEARWIREMKSLGFQVPEFAEGRPSLAELQRSVRGRKIGGVEPWGWSPEVLDALSPLRDQLLASQDGRVRWTGGILRSPAFSETGLGPLFSKKWSCFFLKEWLKAHPESEPFFGGEGIAGTAYESLEALRARAQETLAAGSPLVLKAPYGTSGNQVKRLFRIDELESSLGGWIRNTLKQQGALIAEPLLDKVFDLSIQLEVTDSEPRFFEPRRFLTTAMWQYRGTILGRGFPGLAPELQRFLHHGAIESWKRLAQNLAGQLRAEGYHGPVGIDALVYRTGSGDLRMKPVVEVNPRWTMGRIALALEDHTLPGKTSVWWMIPLTEIRSRGFPSAVDYAEAVRKNFPVSIHSSAAGLRISDGAVFTNPPEAAAEVLTLFHVNPPRLDFPALLPTGLTQA